MRLFYLFHFLMNVSNKKLFVPSCKDCIFYMISESKNGIEKCKKYGEIDDFTGKVVFYPLEKCRGDELRCGSNGVHFFPKDKETNNI